METTRKYKGKEIVRSEKMGHVKWYVDGVKFSLLAEAKRYIEVGHPTRKWSAQ